MGVKEGGGGEKNLRHLEAEGEKKRSEKQEDANAVLVEGRKKRIQGGEVFPEKDVLGEESGLCFAKRNGDKRKPRVPRRDSCKKFCVSLGFRQREQDSNGPRK